MSSDAIDPVRNNYMSKHRCCIERSVGYFFAWIDGDSNSLGVSLSVTLLELPDRVSLFHTGPYYNLQFVLLQQRGMEVL